MQLGKHGQDQWCVSSHYGHPPSHSGRSNIFPTITKKVMKWIRSRKIILQPFLLALTKPAPRINSTRMEDDPLDLSSFLKIYLIPPSIVSCNSSLVLLFLPRRGPISQYKNLIPSPPITTSPSQAESWISFWKLQIPLPARTIWYPALHGKIPTPPRVHSGHYTTRSLLHKMNPTIFPTDNCPRCSNNPLSNTESITHFLFTCPSSVTVWVALYSEYVSPNITTVQLQYLLDKLLHISGNHPRLFTSISCGLQAIWLSHWNAVFQNRPFETTAVINLTFKLSHTLLSELLTPD
ncbi:hypothetical protein BDB01DRAFT_753569 [Pilobolus umbonatus]|nr:hypothetical protein BDB01DRAFT_753569 [Pilobolus umbonatus]